MASSEKRKRVLSSGRLLSVSDIHNTRHPPRHPMLSPREILFSFPEVQSASPTSFVVVHRLHLVSRFSLTLPPFNPTQLSALWKVSQRDRPFFRVLFVFPRAKPSFEAFSLAFLESHYRHWLIVGKFCCTADDDEDDDSTVNRIYLFT